MSSRTDKVKQIFRSMFTLRNDMASYEEIENTIVSGSKFQGTNACILVLAILVASIGLNMNSTAVIIGAMLISPLMGGITAIAYGFATNNLGLAKWSAFRLSIQVLISIAASWAYFTISPMNAPSSELLARTSPTIWDVLIAVCGGLAGIIGQTRKEKSNVIPGVAIATALMPPLCTAGYGLAHLEFSYFFGALYLFFINGFFICITAVIVLKYLRVPQYTELSKKQLSKIHRSMAVVAVITMLPSIYLAYHIVSDTIENNNAENYIKSEFVFDGTQVVQKNIDINKDTIEVSVIGKSIDGETEELLKNKLGEYNLSNYKLTITQTKVESGITQEEVQAMIDSYGSDEEEIRVEDILLQKENEDLREENEQLRQQAEALQGSVDAAEKRSIDVKQLSSELSAINEKIKGAAASYSDVYLNSKDITENKVLVTLLVSENLKKAELDTIENWLVQRLSTDRITLFQQKVSEYTGEETESKAQSDKSDTDKNEKKSDNTEKTDNSKAE